MTQEDKELLLKDLCARLPYGVKVYNEPYVFDLDNFEVISTITETIIEVIEEGWKPYLRPMSSMTEEERFNFQSLAFVNDAIMIFDWLHSHHFDCRGLIPKGLALEAPKGMYN